MKNKKLMVVAPGVLGPLGKNSDLSQFKFETSTFNHLLTLSNKIQLTAPFLCKEQLLLAIKNNNNTVANDLAKQNKLVKADQHYLMADFTGLHIELDHVRLGTKIILTSDEKQQLVEELNTWYEDLALTFVVGDKGDVFILSDTAFDIDSYPTSFVVGKNIQHFLPKNKTTHNWLQLSNEMQMVLFQSKINKQRKSDRLPEIKNIWFWGEQKGSELPQVLKTEENYDLINIEKIESALSEQDSYEWLSAIETLDKQLESTINNYEEIQMFLDYERCFVYKKSFKTKCVKWLNLKNKTLTYWMDAK